MAAKISDAIYNGTKHIYLADIDGKQVMIVDRDGNGSLVREIDSVDIIDVAIRPSGKDWEKAQRLVAKFRAQLPTDIALFRDAVVSGLANGMIEKRPIESFDCKKGATFRWPHKNGGVGLSFNGWYVDDGNSDGKADSVSFKTPLGVTVSLRGFYTTCGSLDSLDRWCDPSALCAEFDPRREGVAVYLQAFDALFQK